MDTPRCLIRTGTTIIYKMGGVIFQWTITSDIKQTGYSDLMRTHFVKEIQMGIQMISLLCWCQRWKLHSSEFLWTRSSCQSNQRVTYKQKQITDLHAANHQHLSLNWGRLFNISVDRTVHLFKPLPLPPARLKAGPNEPCWSFCPQPWLSYCWGALTSDGVRKHL